MSLRRWRARWLLFLLGDKTFKRILAGRNLSSFELFYRLHGKKMQHGCWVSSDMWNPTFLALSLAHSISGSSMKRPEGVINGVAIEWLFLDRVGSLFTWAFPGVTSGLESRGLLLTGLSSLCLTLIPAPTSMPYPQLYSCWTPTMFSPCCFYFLLPGSLYQQHSQLLPFACSQHHQTLTKFSLYPQHSMRSYKCQMSGGGSYPQWLDGLEECSPTNNGKKECAHLVPDMWTTGSQHGFLIASGLWQSNWMGQRARRSTA